MKSIVQRFPENPLLSPADIRPSEADFVVEGVLNPGVFRFAGKTWLVLRIAERPAQDNGRVTFPVLNARDELELMIFDREDPDLDLSDVRLVKHKGITYLSTISHLRLMCSDDDVHFYEPDHVPSIIRGRGPLESFGIEDCRVATIDGRYYLTFTEVSASGVGVGLMHTADWHTFTHAGMIIPPHNKDCAVFEEKIGDYYYCLHRPSGVDLGGNFIWLSRSPDLQHWGDHHCLVQTRPGHWDSARVGAGCSPIKTERGWLAIYHGADSNHRYCLGAVLLDLDDPRRVLARSDEPLMEPDMPYEQQGFFGNVVFTNGHYVDGDEIVMYYGASDEFICGARLSVRDVLRHLGL